METIYVFGRGKYWQYKSDAVKRLYQVIGYIDNKKGEALTADGIPVFFPREVACNKAVRIAVMTGSGFWAEMVEQLLTLGVEERRIILGGSIAPFFNAGEEIINQAGGTLTVQEGKIVLLTEKEKYVINNEAEYKCAVRKLAEKTPFYAAVKNMPVTPISRNYGAEFGKPIDRHYIEKFLEDNREYICGDVIEIEDNTYTKKYGYSLKSCVALHVENRADCIQGNLDTGDGINDGMADCLICTQTLQYIYHPENAMKNIWKMLKTGGTVLITMPFLCQYFEGAHSWNDYWRATPQCLKKALEEIFGAGNVAVGSMGNIKTAIGFLYGLPCEDMNEADFDYNDKEYPVTVWAVCRRR